MLNKPPRTARQVVFRVLEHCQKTGEYFTEPLKALSLKADLGPMDRRLAREMVAGIIRRQATLDALIAPQIRRSKENVEVPLWLLLRMGVYELAFLQGIPAHASVNETTELARYLRRPRWTGFLNGTLRSVSRGLLDETTESPAADAFPVSPRKYRKCTGAWFPDPNTDPIGYFAAAFSFPKWLVERWHRQSAANAAETPAGQDVALSPLPLGERSRGIDQNGSLSQTLVDLGFWFNSPPSLMLRVNPLKTSRESLLARFAAENIPAEPADFPEAVSLKESRNITELPGFAEGHFSVQDLTAMKAVALLDPKPGEIVWDVCAAPGTKASAIAERMQNQGRVLATDIHPDRLALIHDNRKRLGLEILEIEVLAEAGDQRPAGPFDAVLLDVPCSNTGVLGKRPEARWRLKPGDLEELPRIQLGLVESACDRIRPGGRLVYSTCSIEPEENQAIVQAFLNRRPGFTLVEQQTHWPGRPADGGFQALLRPA